jgi:heavy metal sensor kinase
VKPLISRSSLRGRLATWSTLVLLAALLLYAAIVYVSLRQVLWHELDERLHNDIETLEGLLQPYWTTEGPHLPPGESVLDADDYRWMEVWSRDGRLLFSSGVAAAEPIAALAVPPSDRALSLDLGGRGPVRVKEESGHIDGHPVIVRVVASEARLHQEIVELLWLVGLAMPVVAGLAALGGYHLVKGTLRPVDRLVAGANAVTAERLDVRLPVANPRDEVGQIAQAFNATLAKLETAFDQMRRFTANASHELRTPLTALRTTGQVALAGAEGADDYREAIADMLEDVEQLSRVLDTMILLAQADAGTILVEPRQVDLDALVTDVVRECDVLAQEKEQRVSLACTAGQVHADPTILRIAIANLLHNAIRYAPVGSEVAVRATADAASWIIEVQDAGPGIAPEHHPHLFERFYRVDPGRSRALGGVGLGLAMARWSVQAHGGQIQVLSRVGAGSTFRIVLPRRSGPGPHARNPERLDS